MVFLLLLILASSHMLRAYDVALFFFLDILSQFSINN